jgi:Bacterial Ig domain
METAPRGQASLALLTASVRTAERAGCSAARGRQSPRYPRNVQSASGRTSAAIRSSQTRPRSRVGDDVEHGTLTLQTNGQFVYTLAPGFAGEDSFNIRDSDGSEGSKVAAIRIVVAQAPSPGERTLSSLSPAKLWIGLKNSDAVGLHLDLKAEVLLNGTKLGEGQRNNVSSGSSGFNNAKLNTIPRPSWPPPRCQPPLSWS